MAKSLADQLQSLGLADKKQIQKDKAEKRKNEKLARKHKIESQDDAKLRAEQARKEKAERDRQLNLERQQALREKEVVAQAKQMIQHAQLTQTEGEVKYNFIDSRDNKIKSIYVSDAIQNDLAKGRLAIASFDSHFAIIPKNMAEKIQERSPQSIVCLAVNKSIEQDEDDPYKDFVVPDDLMW